MTEGKVSPGQDFNPPPAAIWNNMVDAGRSWAADRFKNPAGPPTRPRETDIIKVKNASGAARRKGEVLKIDDKAIETVTDEQIWLMGKAITADCYFGILKRPAENASVESLQVSGVCIALVDITNVDHTKAGAVVGSYVLESSASGPLEILYQPGEIGEQECVVRFGGGAGGGGETIWFTIAEVLCPDTDYVAETTLVVTPTWYSRSCTGTPPGAEYGGEYYVYDLCNYLYGLTPSDLLGTTGRATYMHPLTGACEPKWIIDDLCAQPEC